MMKNQGYGVIGITLKLYDDAKSSKECMYLLCRNSLREIMAGWSACVSWVAVMSDFGMVSVR